MMVIIPEELIAAREFRKSLVLEVEQYRNLMHFVHCPPYTIAWRRTLNRIIQVSTTVCNPGDVPDSLVGMREAGQRMLDGAYILLSVPRPGSRNVRRFLRKMFSTQ